MPKPTYYLVTEATVLGTTIPDVKKALKKQKPDAELTIIKGHLCVIEEVKDFNISTGKEV